jgi:NADPH:quinone reductase-like Zn-dependent oxidoreductase
MSAVDDVGSVISQLASLIERERLEVPVAATFALQDVRQAFELLEQRHTRGKIVLITRSELASAGPDALHHSR